MKLTNRIFILLLSLMLIFNLVGCVKIVSIEYENVEVTIVDEHYRAMWMQPMIIDKVTTFITYPDEWEITVEYNGVEYTIDDEHTYKKYNSKIGQTAIGELEIKIYDDGTVKYDIVSLE